MKIVGNLIMLSALILAGFSGSQDLKFYWIFIASAAFAVGYFFVRASLIHSILNNDGISGVMKLFLIQTLFMAPVTGLIYYLSSLI